MRKGLGLVMAALVAWVGGTVAASAQTLGTFSWQLTPYCNVITVTVTQNGSNYTLDGYDNQCGGSTRAAVLGMAVPNPTGTVTLGFAIVTPPSATPVHVTTVIDLGSLGGSWSDDQGNTGTFVFTPSGIGSGSPRPAALNGLADNTVTTAKIVDGAIGGVDINAAEVQRRVSSTCPSGQLMTGVTESGGVTCEAVSSTSGGDITAVNAGSGLSGGGSTGDVTLAIGTGGVTTTHLANNAVNSLKVVDGSIGGADVDPTQIQARVSGTCPAGQAMRVINQSGTVTCETVSGGAGDITAVIAGTGLIGGGQAGDATLSVQFSGTGTQLAAAHADHTHSGGSGTTNTAIGAGTMPLGVLGQFNAALGVEALAALTTGNSNTGVGYRALSSTSIGDENTAVGMNTLLNNTSGTSNTGVGSRALGANATGSDNTAVGREAGVQGGSRNTALGSRALQLGVPTEFDNTAIGFEALKTADGRYNTAVGARSLDALTIGNRNLALGWNAGSNLTTGSDNVYLDHVGVAGESGVIRIGSQARQTAFFAAGVRGVTTGINNAQAVMIDSSGQLGTANSSRKTKFDIADLEMSVPSALQRLRPVQFRYLKPFADGSTPIQYGLIAEEVEQVLPELVAYDEHGDPASVKYHVLPSLLLAEVQRLGREVAQLQQQLVTLTAVRR